MADPYSTLGVARTATEAEIKSAYRKLAKQLHPDRNKDNPKAAERFSKAARAYDLLSDKTKRGQFDRGEIDAEGNPASPFAGMGGGFGGGGQRGFRPEDFQGVGSGDMDLGDLFEGLFGAGGTARRGSTSGFGRADRRRRARGPTSPIGLPCHLPMPPRGAISASRSPMARRST